MARSRTGQWVCLGLAAVLAATAGPEADPADRQRPTVARPAAADPGTVDLPGSPADLFASLPLRFEVNEGQTDPEVRFMARGAASTLFLTPGEAVLALGGSPAGAAGQRPPDGTAVLRQRLVAARADPEITGLDRLPGRTNIFHGRDPAGWQSGVAGYARVRYSAVYPGVDLVYHGDGGGLEYDFVVAPGADPGVISMEFDGASAMTMGDTGDLVLSTGGGQVRHRRPQLYQEIAGARRTIPGHFVMEGERRVGFSVGPYDRTLPLVIDPVLEYATYLGGTGDEHGTAVAVDKAGHAYITGRSLSPDFPTKGSFQLETGVALPDVFVAKLDTSRGAAGLLWATYLGGGGTDIGTGIAVGPQGEVVVTGTTVGRPDARTPPLDDFPTTPGALKVAPSPPVGNVPDIDAFASKLVTAADGGSVSLAYSTLLGSGGQTESSRQAPDTASAIAVTGSGNLLVTGETGSIDFPTTSGAFDPTCGAGAACDATTQGGTDAFLTRIDPTKVGSAALVYSTYLAGGGRDFATGVAVDPADPAAAGHAYVTGKTFSADFPTTGTFGSAGRQLFVVRVDTDPGASGGQGAQSLVYSARFGGTSSEQANAIAARSGQAFVTGQTFSPDFPVAPSDAFQPQKSSGSDAFVARIDTTRPPVAGSLLPAVAGSLVYSTYLGGTTLNDAQEAGNAIAVAADGSAHVAGVTGAADFPVRDAFQDQKRSLTATGTDAFLARVNATGTGLISSTYFGGSDDDQATGVALDDAGIAYLSGTTASPDLPRLDAPFQGQIAGALDAFLAKVTPGSTPAPVVATVAPGAGPTGGGTPVEITGRGFTGATRVRFGTAPAEFRVVSDTLLTAVTPSGPPGSVPVTVERGEAQSFANSSATFTYGAEGAWTATGPPATARYGHTATLLADGRVLVVGGVDADGTGLASVEIYDPRAAADQAGAWSTVAPMSTVRSRHTATLLPGGKVLVAGGARLVNSARTHVGQAEVYDPSAGPLGTWTAVPGPTTARYDHTATMLVTGKVLVAGGIPPPGVPSPLSTAELFDPATGQWSPTGDMGFARRIHTATALADGRVLVAGGRERGDNPIDQASPPMEAEAYDPVTGRWRTIAPPITPRLRHAATLLSNGTVLVTGGRLEFIASVTSSVEVHDPTSERPFVSAQPLLGARLGHAAVNLPGGRAMVTGGVASMTWSVGRDTLRPPLRSAEVFVAASGTWRSAGQMTTPRGPARVEGLVDGNGIVRGHTATLLSSDPDRFAADPAACGRHCGKVLVVGGSPEAKADLYTPAPTVTAVSPGAGSAEGGSRVQITGTGFTHGTVSVAFGGATAQVVAASFDALDVVVPAPTTAASVAVAVTNEGGTAKGPSDFRFDGPPGRVGDLAATALSETEVRLTFSAPGSVGRLLPPASRFVLKQSRTPIEGDASFDAALTLCDEASCGYVPASVGDVLSRSVTGLRAGTSYYYAVRAVGENGIRGPISNIASVTTSGLAPAGTPDPCPSIPPAGAGRVVYPGGYVIVGLPERAPAPGAGLLYGWLNQGAGGSYDRMAGGQPVTAGRGFWAWNPCPRAVTTSGSLPVALRLPLGANRASLVGNPSGTAPARVTGFDYAAKWDPTLNGVGGYRLSAFRAAQSLAIGEGMWVFSFTATTVVIEAP